MESSNYNFKGLDIHGALIVTEQVRKEIKMITGESKADEAVKTALTRLSDALTEHVYQETLMMEQQTKLP